MATSTGRRKGGINGREGLAGWLFTLPALLIVGVFLAIPVLMALWVSVSDWKGFGPPIGGRAQFVGIDNYADVIYTDFGSNPALAQKDFGTSIRNNFYYVLLVVPLQTALALFLAVQVNRRMLRGKGFFRTAFYVPSVTSSIAITTVWLFLFTASGAVNQIIGFFGAEIDEAALMDGAGAFRKFFSVTLPMLKPTLFTVLTLGLIGTWQVFDQIYLSGGGAPGKTTLTPAFLAYETSFDSLKWGRGAAIAFVLFGIIVAMTLIQRWVLRDRDLGAAGVRRERRGVAALKRDAAAAGRGSAR